jgi:hypothetical protein
MALGGMGRRLAISETERNHHNGSNAIDTSMRRQVLSAPCFAALKNG